MLAKLAGCARIGAQLLLIELFVPGGTLMILMFLWARRRGPLTLSRLAARAPFGWKSGPDTGTYRQPVLFSR